MVHADTSHMCDHVNICGMQLVVVRIPSLLAAGKTIVICLAHHRVNTSIPKSVICRIVIYFEVTLQFNTLKQVRNVNTKGKQTNGQCKSNTECDQLHWAC